MKQVMVTGGLPVRGTAVPTRANARTSGSAAKNAMASRRLIMAASYAWRARHTSITVKL